MPRSRGLDVLLLWVLLVVGMGSKGGDAVTSYLGQVSPTSINCFPDLRNDTFALSEVPESAQYLYMRDNGFVQPASQLMGSANTTWSNRGVRMVLRTRVADVVGAPLFVHPEVVLASVLYVQFTFAPVGSTGNQEVVNATFDSNAEVTVWGNRTQVGQWTVIAASIVFLNASATFPNNTITRSIAIGNLPARLKSTLLVDKSRQVPMYFRPDASTFCYPLYPSATFRVSVGSYLPDIKLWLMTAQHQNYVQPALFDPPVVTVQLNSTQGITTLTTVNLTETVVGKTGLVSLTKLFFNQPLGAVQLLFTLDTASATRVNAITFFIPFSIHVYVSSYAPTNPLVAADGPVQRYFQCVPGIVGVGTHEVPVGSPLGGLVIDASTKGMFSSYRKVVAVMQPIYVATGLPLRDVDAEHTTVVDGLARFASAYIPPDAVGNIIAFQIYFDDNPDIVLQSNPLRAVAPATYNSLSLWPLNEMLSGPSSTFVATSGITLPRILVLVKSSMGDVNVDVAAAQLRIQCYLSSSASYINPVAGGLVPIVDGVAIFSSLQFIVATTTKCRLVISAVGFLVADPLITKEGYLYSAFTKAVTISFSRHYLLSPYHRQYSQSTLLSNVPLSDVVIYVRNSDWSVDRTNGGQMIQVSSSSAVSGSYAYSVGGEVHFHSLYVPACTISCRLAFTAVKRLGTSAIQDNTMLVTGEIFAEQETSSVGIPRLSINGTGLSLNSADIVSVKADGVSPTMFLVEFLDPDLTVHPYSVTSIMTLDPKRSGAVLGGPLGNATYLSPTSHQQVTESGSALFGAVFTAGRGTAELSFCLDANVALISSCVSVSVLVGMASSPLMVRNVILSSLDNAVVNPVVVNAFTVSVRDPTDAALPTPAPTPPPTTTTTTTTTPPPTTTTTSTTAASTTTVATTTSSNTTTNSTTEANTTTDSTTEANTTTDSTTTTETTTTMISGPAAPLMGAAAAEEPSANATGTYSRPTNAISLSLLYPHQGSTNVDTMYTILPPGSSSFDQVHIASPLRVIRNIRISPLVTDGDGSSWNAAGFRQDDVDPTPETTVVAYVDENIASFKVGTWLRILAEKVNVHVDRFEVVRTGTAVVPLLGFVGTRIEINIRPPSVFSDGKKDVTNLINEVKQSSEGCLATPSTEAISIQGISEVPFCDVNELQERVESARHCENSLGRDERCNCFKAVMAQYGPACQDAPIMGPTCEHLTLCTDSGITDACAGAQENIAVQVVIVVFSTAGCLLLVVLVLRFNTLRRELGQRRARLKKGRSHIVGKPQHHDDVFVG